MKQVAPNTTNRSGTDVDDIDALMGAFFKGEMPASWPAFQRPVSLETGRVSSTDEEQQPRVLPFRASAVSSAPNRPARPAAALPWWSSRLALVASVGLLLLVGWLLPTANMRWQSAPDAINTLGPHEANPRGVLPGVLPPPPATKEQPEKLTPDNKSSKNARPAEQDEGPERAIFKIPFEDLLDNK